MPSGRLIGDVAGAPLVAADATLGAGWGTTATIAFGAGSNDMRGSFTVTSGGTGQAQATATVAVALKVPLDSAAFVIACRGGGTAVLTVVPKVVAVSKTGFTIISNTLPVTGETTEFYYFVS